MSPYRAMQRILQLEQVRMKMSNDAQTSLVRITTPVVMIFPNVVVAVPYKIKGKPTGEPAFGASFVFPPTHPELAALKAAIVAVAKEKWPGRDIGADYVKGQLMLPFTKGDKLIADRQAQLTAAGKQYRGENDFMAGALVVKAGTKKFPPQLGYWDAAQRKWIDLTEENKATHAGKFFFGAEVCLELNVSAYDKVNTSALDGVKAYLQKVYATGKGTRLSGGQPGSEVFSGYAGSVSDSDPTAGMKDETPF